MLSAQEFVHDLVAKRVVKATTTIGSLEQLCDPQSELLLLCSCIGLSKLQFSLGTNPPSMVEGSISEFDDALRLAVESIFTAGGPGFGKLQRRLASMPSG